ncbi:MAG: DUF4215 domain-containing protein [Myxococcota bacterium]
MAGGGLVAIAGVFACTRANPAFDASESAAEASETSAVGEGTTGVSGSVDDSDAEDTALPPEATTSGGLDSTSSPLDDTSSGDECTSDEECPEGMVCDSSCVAVCGDGLVLASEACDDGNDVDGDGCDVDCTPTELVVGASFVNTCVLIEGGRARCWGENGYGQLGLGHTDDTSQYEAWQGGDLPLPGPLRQLGMGDNHFCGVLAATDDVICWGEAEGGMLGYANTTALFAPPAAAVEVGFPVRSMVGGQYHSCALGLGGEVACWGFGPELGYGHLHAIGDDESPSSQGTVLVPAGASISAGVQTTCIVDDFGAILCWGANDSGQLGVGHLEPVGDNETPNDLLFFDQPALTVEAGYHHTCALFAGGSVRCWGSAVFGQLGRGDEQMLGHIEPVTTIEPVEFGERSLVVDLTVGDRHSCVLFEDGRAKCWGLGLSGQLGQGGFDDIGDDERPSEIPTIDLGGQRILQIEAGGDHTCAVVEGHQLYCWGENDSGQLGLGHTLDVSNPLDGWVPVHDPA